MRFLLGFLGAGLVVLGIVLVRTGSPSDGLVALGFGLVLSVLASVLDKLENLRP